MTFSFYHSLITQPRELDEAARLMRLTKWERFWRLDVPVVDDRTGLERDDELRRRLVLPDRVGSDHGQRQQSRAARHRQLRRATASANGELGRVLLGDRGDDRHGARCELLVLAAARRVVGEVPHRAERGRGPAAQHHARHAAPVARSRACSARPLRPIATRSRPGDACRSASPTVRLLAERRPPPRGRRRVRGRRRRSSSCWVRRRRGLALHRPTTSGSASSRHAFGLGAITFVAGRRRSSSSRR